MALPGRSKGRERCRPSLCTANTRHLHYSCHSDSSLEGGNGYWQSRSCPTPRRTVWERTPLQCPPDLAACADLEPIKIFNPLLALLSILPPLPFLLSSIPNLPSHNFLTAFSSQTSKQFQQGAGFRFLLELQFHSAKDRHQPRRFPERNFRQYGSLGSS